MVRSVEAQRDHSEALAIWRASLGTCCGPVSDAGEGGLNERI